MGKNIGRNVESRMRIEYVMFKVFIISALTCNDVKKDFERKYVHTVFRPAPKLSRFLIRVFPYLHILIYTFDYRETKLERYKLGDIYSYVRVPPH